MEKKTNLKKKKTERVRVETLYAPKITKTKVKVLVIDSILLSEDEILTVPTLSKSVSYAKVICDDFGYMPKHLPLKTELDDFVFKLRLSEKMLKNLFEYYNKLAENMTSKKQELKMRLYSSDGKEELITASGFFRSLSYFEQDASGANSEISFVPDYFTITEL